MAKHGNVPDFAMEPGGEHRQTRRSMLRLVMAHQLSTLSLSLLTMQARMQLLSVALSGDSRRVAKQVSRGAVFVALSDLLLSPTVGKLSDIIGRKPIMLLAPAVALPCKLLAAARPSVAVLLAERVFCDAFRTIGGTTMAYACICDLYHGEDFTKALGQLNSATGLGIVLAPLVATAFMGQHGNPRRAYWVSAALAMLHLVLGSKLLQETLALTEIRSGTAAGSGRTMVQSCWRALHAVKPPWNCIDLFRRGLRLRLRAMLFAVHCLLEGKALQDQVAVLQVGQGWGTELRSRWTSGLGLAITIGGQGASWLISRFGEHPFTAACHFASFAAFIGLQRSNFWSSLALLCLGQQRRSVSTSWIVAEARQAGVGHGEVIGWMASLRSAADAISSMLYGTVYRVQAKKGREFDVFIVPAALVLLAELLRTYIAVKSVGERKGGGSSVA
mmetsp:Transcript_69865/g.138247  ORF Transcript_69865/g.138247 Transcript_69865/m.138247 type:complete len:445 (-) Transcript_69865:39-1373(-)